MFKVQGSGTGTAYAILYFKLVKFGFGYTVSYDIGNIINNDGVLFLDTRCC
jgi:hypothetical protein